MAKPIFNFYFADEPQYAVVESREWIANALRSYRKHANRYELHKLGTHHYSVQVRGSNAIAVIAA
jgi:hypothetical protein